MNEDVVLLALQRVDIYHCGEAINAYRRCTGGRFLFCGNTLTSVDALKGFVGKWFVQ
jgi:hypothetical protein